MKKFSDYAEKARDSGGNFPLCLRFYRVGDAGLFLDQRPGALRYSQRVPLAGLPKEEALIDLNLWRSKDKPEVQKIWQRLSKMIGCALLVSILNSQNIEKNQNLEISDNDHRFTADFIYYA